MKRAFALTIAAALLLVVPGAASADTARSPINQQAVNTVIQRALSQRGVPYTYGGGDINGPTKGVSQGLATAPTVQPPQNGPGQSSPGQALGAVTTTPSLLGSLTQTAPTSDVVGFDASGLIVYAFAGAGIKMPRSSGEQYKVGQKVLPQQALPGDLLFYGPDGTQSVALFTGNGQMVETTEQGVALSPVRTANMTPYLVRIIA
ncbi:hydrolase [Mycolicibacterium insubricum]|uniref:Hydrolase n=1 Tax=Mycolicibacterium insubricum TaxID=444597 RepID=A0A1X0CRU7_9MYCO|nr:NlpC/P60 family peptidoglycan-binding protein RipD [Mycolicibacterium insubricum]MCB9441722.1 NlpC/P60 family peptidoglycan-binding protein RipD [Mycolicibacterium sp.]MCV7082997.1 NlpC/P60 family peptidoglycan-binding protein RipD [Mycolicibacterium insubricum]ORA62719.1 hydrolase [Mycolicibacterium insubricum]BBZ67330.1 hydrolase [Mycolicibacterium insubricum]